MAAEPTRRRTTRRLPASTSRSISTHAGRTTVAALSIAAAVVADTSDRGRRLSRQTAEGGGLAEEGEVDGAGLSVSVLGDDQLGDALRLFVLRVVDLVAVDEGDEIGVLFDRTRLT